MAKRIACILVTGSALACSAVASPNLIINGDFSTGDASGWTQAGDTFYNEVSGNAFFSGPFESMNYISQTIDTTVGQGYELTFDLDNGYHSGYTAGDYVAPNAFTAGVDGSSLISLTNELAFDWTHYETTFVASSDKTVVSFGFLNAPSYYGITNISAAVPEPVSMATVAVAGSILTLRRRKEVPVE